MKTWKKVRPARDAALYCDRPCLIDACVDPDVPTLPHIAFAEAKSCVDAVLDDPESGGVIKQTLQRVFS